MKKIVICMLFFVLLFGANGVMGQSENISLESLQKEISDLKIQIEEIKSLLQIEEKPTSNNIEIGYKIEKPGQYLVPSEMSYGKWMAESKSNSSDNYCVTIFYSDLSATTENLIDLLMDENRSYFILDERIKLVDLSESFSDCTWTYMGK